MPGGCLTAHRTESPDGARRTVAPGRNGTVQSRAGSLLGSCVGHGAVGIVARCFLGSRRRLLEWLPKWLGGEGRRDLGRCGTCEGGKG